jgi:hypothetical protein
MGERGKEREDRYGGEGERYFCSPFSSGFFPEASPRIPGIAFFLLVAPPLPTMTSVLMSDSSMPMAFNCSALFS